MSKRNVAPRVDGDPEDMTPVYSKEPESCEGCFFDDNIELMCPVALTCYGESRSDGRSVIFIERESA